MEPTPSSHHGYISSKDDYLKRLRRIEGQARGLQKMVEDEKYCIDILTQVSAMTSALQSVALGLLMIISVIASSAPPRRADRRPIQDQRSLQRDRPPRPLLSPTLPTQRKFRCLSPSNMSSPA